MIRKITLALAVLAISSWNADAQKAANNWYFGNHARINFNSGVPTATTVTTINTGEGCSAISDSNGNLLFYTDGMTVWDKNDAPMTGGSGLDGDKSSTHSALIVPCSCDKYFIFTTDSTEHHYAKGLRYSIVDMTQNGGLGAVTSKNNILLPNASEKVAGVADGSGGFWVAAHEMGNTSFYSYHIVAGSDCTLDPKLAIISKVGSSLSGGTGDYGQGQMKFSPDGKWLAHAGLTYGPGSFVELFQFNTNTGTISNSGPAALDSLTSGDGFYGIEFSPDSNALYATTTVANSNIYRYGNITANQLTSRAPISNFASSPQYAVAALQLAPDGKIYVARKNNQSLYVLSNPVAPNGGWTTTPFNLATGSSSQLGLPTVVAGNFSCAPLCGTITEPNAKCDHGVFTYTFTVTNNTSQPIEWLLFSTPASATYGISPPYIHLGTPLPPGGHTSASVSITNASPGDHICLNVALADKDVVSCCTIQTCFDLCPCLKITDAKAVCAPGDNGYTFTATIQNLTGVAVQQLFVVPISPANINVTLSPTTMPIPFPGGTTVTGTITGAGAQPGAQVCLRFVPFGTEAQCCSTKLCFVDPLPPCHHHPPPSPPDQPQTKKPKK
jgi:hypothetical protein